MEGRDCSTADEIQGAFSAFYINLLATPKAVEKVNKICFYNLSFIINFLLIILINFKSFFFDK